MLRDTITDDIADRSVLQVDECYLALGGDPWPFARRNADSIERHWRKRVARNPRFFNGKVLVADHYGIRNGRLAARLLSVDFAAHLYWEDCGLERAAGNHLFGCALLHSADGALIFGRAASHTLHAGRVYPMSGYLDLSDVTSDGVVSLDANVARELREETGLDARALERRPGYVVTRFGARVVIAIVYVSDLTADALTENINMFCAARPNHELTEVVPIHDALGLDKACNPDYAIALARHCLGG